MVYLYLYGELPSWRSWKSCQVEYNIIGGDETSIISPNLGGAHITL